MDVHLSVLHDLNSIKRRRCTSLSAQPFSIPLTFTLSDTGYAKRGAPCTPPFHTLVYFFPVHPKSFNRSWRLLSATGSSAASSRAAAASVGNRQCIRSPSTGLVAPAPAVGKTSGNYQLSDSSVRGCGFPSLVPAKEKDQRYGDDDDCDEEEEVLDWTAEYGGSHLEVEPSIHDPRDESTADRWIERNPSLIRLTGKHPFNCEPPLARLMHHGFVTPVPLHSNTSPISPLCGRHTFTFTLNQQLFIIPCTTTCIIEISRSPALMNPGKRRVQCNLVAKKTVSHDVRLFRFALPSADQVLGLPVGKHIFLCATIDGKLCMRPYTPTSPVDEIGHFELLINVYFKGENPKFPNGGLMSQHLESLPIGSTLDVKGPLGHIEYAGRGNFLVDGKHRSTRRLAMIAGGTGITPVYQVIQAVLRDPENRTEMHLVYANRSEDDILLRDELDILLQKSYFLLAFR
ncbi:unnamed protein product [Musa acuminata subsp. malaccensis]|uniref:(wild Malaysian banana) hypothetical protein n=1 Tax=Musa acuminata subsp. malaccensis TaxID=214687 RepID=A0A804J1A6_MUSAM|nr:unnamed protein product [Musa acuminata subsp. malaccensis]